MHSIIRDKKKMEKKRWQQVEKGYQRMAEEKIRSSSSKNSSRMVEGKFVGSPMLKGFWTSGLVFSKQRFSRLLFIHYNCEIFTLALYDMVVHVRFFALFLTSCTLWKWIFLFLWQIFVFVPYFWNEINLKWILKSKFV